MTDQTTIENDASKSALQDNIDRMGKNAYYFAHAHKANGPKWDGKIEPRLLSSSSSNLTTGDTDEGISESMTTISVASSSAAKALASRSISLSKSNITNYAFMDEGNKIKIYVNLSGVGNTPTENIVLESSETSMCLTIKDYVVPITPAEEDDNDDLICDTSGGETDENYNEEKQSEPEKKDRCLSFAQLFGNIESASFKKKQDKIIVILKKKDVKAWSSVIA